MSRQRTLLVSLLVLAAALPRVARAQGEDAYPVPGGTLRLGIAPDWAHWNSVFGNGSAGFPSGTREALTVRFNSDNLGTAQLPFLDSAQNTLRSITGLGTFSLNLGRAQLTLNQSYRVVPITAEWALSNKLGIRVAVPIVRARSEVFLLGPDSTHRGNVGLNPELLTPGALGSFRTQVDTALEALRWQAANGPAGMRAQAQAMYDQIQPFLCGLYTLAAGNAADATKPCWVATGATASPVLPDTGTAAAHAIDSILSDAKTRYGSLRATYSGVGVDMPDLTASYALPVAALDTNGIQTMVTAPNGIIAGDSVVSMVRTTLGNIEVGGWWQLAASRSWRSQLLFTLRLPTGSPDSPDNFFDLSTGEKALGWQLHMKNDFVLRRDFWLHAGVRVAGWSSSNLVRRVGPPELLILPIFDTASVKRAPGMQMIVDVVPNWQLDDAFRVGIGLHWSRIGQTHYTYVNPADAARLGSASVLDGLTQMNALRLGAGVTFSTLDRYMQHQASVPYDVSAAFNETFYGSGGAVPAAAAFNMIIRFYIGAR